MKRIILASASPRRKELLSQIGLKFEIMPSDADETFDNTVSIEENIKRIAYDKAFYVKPDLDEHCVVIGADTVVSIDNEVLGKPCDKNDAAEMLKKLSGNTHIVYTGYAIIRMSDNKTAVGYEKTYVTFRNLTEDEIEAYISSGEPMDKAGSYGVQGIGAVFVTKINGDYNNVVGLPLCSLTKALETFDIKLFKGDQRNGK